MSLGVALVVTAPSGSAAEPGLITLEGEFIPGEIEEVGGDGTVRLGGKDWQIEGLRAIIPGDAQEVEDTSDGRVVLICGSEIASAGIEIIEEQVMFAVPGLGDWEIPIDAVRALRFGELLRGSRFQKGLLEWEASRDYDTIFLTGGAELQEVDGLIEQVDDSGLSFEMEGAANLKTVPRTRVYGAVLASPLLQDDEWPLCTLSLVGGTRLKADLLGFEDGNLRLALVEGIEVAVPWASVQRIGIRSPRLAYASDLQAAASRSQPIVAPPRQWLRDRTISGAPIKIGDTTYDKGLGFAAGTEVTFDNDGPYDLFLAEIGIDADTRGRGDCEFVVLAGDEELFRKRMRGGEPAQLIKVELEGAPQVTLRVEAGHDLDIADHADWADACFLQR